MVLRRSKLSMIALILGILVILLYGNLLFSSTATNDAEALGEGIAKMIILPSAAMMFVAVLLNLIGYLKSHSTLTLISAIFYVLALVFMPLWGFVGIPSMILQFVAYSKLKRE